MTACAIDAGAITDGGGGRFRLLKLWFGRGCNRSEVQAQQFPDALYVRKLLIDDPRYGVSTRHYIADLGANEHLIVALV